MDLTLSKWDTLIKESLHPDNYLLTVQSPAYWTKIKSAAEIEKSQIRKNLLAQTFDIKDEKEIELLIQRTQGLLVNLQDTLHQYTQRSSLPEPLPELYSIFTTHIHFLLEYIETDFRKYFNIEEKVPVVYLMQSKTEIASQYEPVKAILASRAELDQDFVATLHSSMERFCSIENTNATYRDLIYHKALIRLLLKLGELGKQDCMYSALKETLIYINFNSPAFINYFLTQFKQIKDVVQLSEHLKEISLMHTKPGYRLFPDQPTAKSLLMEALQKEIEFVQTIGGNDPESPETPKDFVHVPFKGAVIYLLVKAFIDAGGATGQIYKTLLEKIAPSLATKTQKGFSAESLSKYSDKVDIDAKETAKRFLQKMIRNIESYD